MKIKSAIQSFYNSKKHILPGTISAGAIFIWCSCASVVFWHVAVFIKGFMIVTISCTHAHLPPSPFPLSTQPTPPPYFNVSVCQVMTRWDVGWILFCWGGRAAVFPVIEHKVPSTAREIIGPECNTANKAQKENISPSIPPSPPPSLFVSSLSFCFLHSKLLSAVAAVFSYTQHRGFI